MLVDVLTMARDKAPKLQCAVIFQGFRFGDSTDAVEKLADSFGHVTKVVSVDTTWGGAGAAFLKRGQCSAGTSGASKGDQCLKWGDAANLMVSSSQFPSAGP